MTTSEKSTRTLDGFDLTGKRALVVGAETPAGQAISAALAEAGAKLVLSESSMSADGSKATLITPGDRDEISGGVRHLTNGPADDIIRIAKQELGGLDVVVNCADARLAGPFETLTDAEWDRLVQTNLTGPVKLFRAAGREMIARGTSGRLIQVVSMLGERGVPNTAAYGATQAALVQLIRTLSLEWARQNIRVNGIGLGWLESDPLLTESGVNVQGLLRYLPTKRFGRPDEIGAIAVYLASDRADMMTGQTLWVDGAAMSHA